MSLHLLFLATKRYRSAKIPGGRLFLWYL